MPHCIIEHSNDLTDLITPQEMMDAALRAIQSSNLFETNDIKIRTKSYAYFQTGEGRQNFIHVTLKILDGRNLAQKKPLAALVLKAMDDLPVFGVEITVEIAEVDSATYLRHKN